MAVPSHQSNANTERPDHDEERPSGPMRTVSVHSTRPERSVFVEADNADGWIATDTTVALER